MKNLSILIVLVIIFLNLTIAVAQTSTNKQLDPALRKFVQSEIIIKFKDL